jgi:hypothetical protein
MYAHFKPCLTHLSSSILWYLLKVVLLRENLKITNLMLRQTYHFSITTIFFVDDNFIVADHIISDFSHISLRKFSYWATENVTEMCVWWMYKSAECVWFVCKCPTWCKFITFNLYIKTCSKITKYHLHFMKLTCPTKCLFWKSFYIKFC